MVSQVLQIRRIVDELLIYGIIQDDLMTPPSYHPDNCVDSSKQRNNTNFYFR